MRRYCVLIIIFLFLGLICNSASAEILTFDDISTQLEFELSELYGGFSWEKVNVRNKRFSPESGFNSNTQSGDYIAYNYFGETSLILNEGRINFWGAYFAGAWGDVEIHVTGATADGTVLTTDSPITVSNNELKWAEINFMGITSLKISSVAKTGEPYRNHFIMDDFSFEESPIYPGDDEPILNPTPEPGSLFLVSVGLLTFLLLHRFFTARSKTP